MGEDAWVGCVRDSGNRVVRLGSRQGGVQGGFLGVKGQVRGGIVGGARVHGGLILRWWGPFSVWREARWAEPAGRAASKRGESGCSAGALLELESPSGFSWEGSGFVLVWQWVSLRGVDVVSDQPR